MSYFNRNKWWAIAFLLLIALNLAMLGAFWLVRDKGPGRGIDPKSGVVDFLVKELGFDSTQKQKLISLREEHQQKMMGIRKNNREAKDAFFDLLQKPDTPDSVIQKAAKESARYDEEKDIVTFHHFQQIRNLCTETQQRKFDAVIQQVLRMIAPPQTGKPEGPPPHGRPEGMHDGPPPWDDHRGPPPTQQ